MKNVNWKMRLTTMLLCIGGIMAPAYSQSIRVQGVISSESGETLPGINVVEKGTFNGAISDFEGNYSIVVGSPNAVIVYSSIGMKDQEVRAEGRSIINITMQDDILGLDEVVVIGYGEVKKSDLTGSVSSVKVEQLQIAPSKSIDGILQGRSAGVQVINTSQDPGAGAIIRIRGGSSLRGSNAPLVVVDGFPLGDAGDLKQINPADVARVEVLKDASASAIYGSKGANGVIMVTTKRAEKGKTEISVQQQTTTSQFTSKLNQWSDPLLMAQLSNEDMINAGKAIIYNGKTNSNGVYYPSLSEIQSGAWPYNTDWADIVFRDMPVSNNTTLSVRSANETTSFNLSTNYFEQQGVYIEDSYNKININLAVQHKINDKLQINTSNIFSRDMRNNNGGLSYSRNPLWPVYDENGDYFRTTITDFGHPLAQTDHVLNESKGLDFITSYLVSYKLTKDLDVKTQFNYKYGNSISDRYNPKAYTEGGYFNNGAGYIDNWMSQDLLSETYLTYNKEFRGIHKLNVMASHSFNSYMSRYGNMGGVDFVNEALGNENLAAGNPEKRIISNGLTRSEMLSYTGRVNYGLMDKYLFTATYRADASSKFGESNKWAMFPSGAASWKAHNEPFIQDLDVFDELKVRASYGISGNQGISPYQTLSRYGNEKYYDNGKWNTAIGPGYEVGREGADDRYIVWGGIPNKDLKWETTAQYNIGLDMAFLDRKVKVVLDVYEKKTEDLLRERWLSLTSGYNKIWVNDGNVTNRGAEVTIDGRIISKPEMSLNATFIFSKNKSEITNLGNEITSGLSVDPNTGMQYELVGYDFTQFRQRPNILAIGQPRNVFYGYKVDGIIQTLEEGVEAGLTGDLAQPGEFKYVDINDDDIIDTKDRTIIGDPNPDFMASLNLDFTYKNFDASIFFNGVFGNDVLYQNQLWQASNMPKRWTMDNPNNEYPRLLNGRQLKLSDWFIKDGSFVRIQNLNVGYNFNMSKVKIVSKLRVYVNASNLYTFTKFKGYDPEVGEDGIYWGGYPRLRNWTFGLNLTF